MQRYHSPADERIRTRRQRQLAQMLTLSFFRAGEGRPLPTPGGLNYRKVSPHDCGTPGCCLCQKAPAHPRRTRRLRGRALLNATV